MDIELIIDENKKKEPIKIRKKSKPKAGNSKETA